MKNTFSCLLPFYNEGQRVKKVIAVISQVPSFSQIVVVDDGSTDSIYQQLISQYPQIELVRLEVNRGKSEAVALGLNKIKSQYVFLCDADLSNLRVEEIELALQKITDSAVDMIILNRVCPNQKHQTTSELMVKTGVACLFSGDRVLRTADLQAIMKEQPRSYQLEVAINQYMIENQKRVGWIKSSAQNHYTYEELGLFETFLKYLKMVFSMIRWTGPAGLIYQLVNWELEEF